MLIRRLKGIKECKVCGTTNMLLKVKDYYLCFLHYKESKAGPSELQALIEEAVRNGLDYFDSLYARDIRRRDRPKRKWFR